MGSTARYESAKPVVARVESDSAVLTVSVPEDAIVIVNGHSTTSEGTVRQFKSKGLRQGSVYTYVVEVKYSVNGEEKVESKSVKLRSGDEQKLEFAVSEVADTTASADVVTVVRLRVPQDAKVLLAGNPTNGHGELRTFRTSQLKAGQQWSGYTIQVTVNVNGSSVSKERTIDVVAGSTNEIDFEFDASAVAVR